MGHGQLADPLSDLVIVQCDQQKGSFLTALDRKTGKTVWKTERDELPSWGTPTIFPARARDELVTNASNFIRGYDPLTGQGTVAAGRQFEDHRAHADLRGRPDAGGERAPSGGAHLRDPRRRAGDITLPRSRREPSVAW